MEQIRWCPSAQKSQRRQRHVLWP